MIRCICVGKIKEKSLQDSILEYVKRIQPYHKTEIIEVEDESTAKQNILALEKEGERILSKIKEREFVILLDVCGKEYDSIAFSKQIDEALSYQGNRVVFVIGGSLGVSESVRKRAQIRWKLSSCTFPHGIVRLLLVEQIYRAFRILNKEPYHK